MVASTTACSHGMRLPISHKPVSQTTRTLGWNGNRKHARNGAGGPPHVPARGRYKGEHVGARRKTRKQRFRTAPAQSILDGSTPAAGRRWWVPRRLRWCYRREGTRRLSRASWAWSYRARRADQTRLQRIFCRVYIYFTGREVVEYAGPGLIKQRILRFLKAFSQRCAAIPDARFLDEVLRDLNI